MADGSIKIDTKIEDKNLDKQIKDIRKNLTEGMKAASKAANVALAGIAAGIAGIAAASGKFAATTDRIDKMSQAVGLSRQVFQELDYTFAQNGASMDALAMGMKTLLEKADANSKSFEMLGVSVRNSNGTLRSQDDILQDTIRAFESLEDGQEKAILAQDLFGRSAQDLMPTLNQTAGSMDALSDRAVRLGLVLSDDAINAGVVFGDTMADVKNILFAVMNSAIEPIIPLTTEAANAFVNWATEGDRLGNVMKTVAETLKNAWNAGVIQTIMAGVVAVKALTVAFAVTNAVMMANPIVLIVAGIIAAVGLLVAAVFLIYKNWDEISTFIMITLKKIQTAFIILGSKMQEAFTVGFNGVKIAIYSLTNSIYQTLFRAFLALIDIVDKLDFANVFSDQLDSARKTVGKWSESLYGAMDTAKEESAAIIKAAKDKQDAIQKASEEILASYTKEKNARLESINNAGKEAEEIISAEGEKGAAIIETTTLTEKQIEEQTKLGDMATETARQIAVAHNKTKDGIISEEEERQILIGIYSQQIDALYEMGATKDGTDEKSEALRGYIDAMGHLKDVTISANEETKKGWKDILSTFVDGTKAAIEIAVSVFSSIGSAIAATFSVIKQIVSASMAVISGLVKFDPEAMLKSLEDTLTGLTDFFMSDIATSPIWFQTGIDMILSFLNGIKESLPVIVETMTNAIASIAQMIIDNAPMIASTAIEIISAIVIVLLNSLPILLEAGITLFLELMKALVIAMPDIIAALTNAIVGMIQVLTDNLPLIISTAIDLFLAIVIGLAKALPVIIQAIVDALPSIIEALVGAIPLIIRALIEAFPYIVAAIIEMLPQLAAVFLLLPALIAIEIVKMLPELAQIGIDLIMGIITGIGSVDIWGGIKKIFDSFISTIKNFFGIKSPSTVFADMGINIIKGLINGILGAGSGIWNAISGIFTGLLDNITNIFSGAFDIGKNMVDGIASGITTATESISSVASGRKITGFGSSGFWEAVSDVSSSGGFASGSPYLENDQIAMVHKGERIVPRTFNQDIMSGDTMMLAPSALSSIIGGIAGGANAIRQSMNLKIDIPLYMDSKEVGRAAFEQMDFMAGGAYGY